MRKVMYVAAIAIGTAGSTQAAPLVVGVDDRLEYSGTLAAPDTATVEGTLRVVAGASFTPASLDLVGSGQPNGNPNALFDELNGDAYLDGGSISIGAINVGSTSRLIVNDTSSAGSVLADGFVVVNGSLSVTGSPGTYTTSGQTTVGPGATLTAATVTYSSDSAEINGEGNVVATSFNLGQGKIAPGIGGGDAGTLMLTSSSINLTNTALDLDFALTDSDQLAINGAVTGVVPVLAKGFLGMTPAEVISHGRFMFLTATTMSADFDVLYPEFAEIYEEDGITFAGNMVIETNATSAYFTFQPVPEPATLGVMSLGVLAMRRRRR